MHGRIIDFEGIDGSGKTTQTALLLKFLKKKQIQTQFYKFPQYKKTIYGKLVADFLAGKLGSLKEVNPYLISLAYGLDRATVADKIRLERKSGKLVVFDRYVSSTKAHQASRMSKTEAGKFLDWLDNFEYKVNKMPKEDLVILLDMPVKNSFELIDDRKKDLLEQKDLQEKTRQIYLKLAKGNKHWLVIDCVDGAGNLKSRSSIHQEIVAVLSQKNII